MTSTITQFPEYTVGGYVAEEHYGAMADNWCHATGPARGFWCSVPKGVEHHIHVAAQLDRRVVEVWPNEATYTVGDYMASEDYRPFDSDDVCGVYGPGHGGFYCNMPKGEHAEHVAAQSTRYVVAVWPNEATPEAEPQAATPEPEPEDEVTAYKRQVREVAQRKLREGYGEYGTWNATLKRLGIEPLTKRTIQVTAPIRRVRLELSASDYSVERAQEWLAARRDPATLAGYLRPDPADLQADQAEVVVEETADVDDDLDSDEDYRADTAYLDTYKELVKEAAGDLQERHSWCDDGTNEVLRELGIDVERDFRVDVQLRAYQTVSFTVSAKSEAEAREQVDNYRIGDSIQRSEWEWDGDWEHDDVQVEED